MLYNPPLVFYDTYTDSVFSFDRLPLPESPKTLLWSVGVFEPGDKLIDWKKIKWADPRPLPWNRICACKKTFSIATVPVDSNLLCRKKFATLADPSCKVLQIEWDFGDGTTHSSQLNPVHEYLQGGTYSVCATITFVNTPFSPKICRRTVCTQVKVDSCKIDCICFAEPFFHASVRKCQVKTANFSSPRNACTKIEKVIWDFGDGTIIQDAGSPQHVYSAPGTYTICLTVVAQKDNTGLYCEKTFCRSVTVSGCGTECSCIMVPNFEKSVEGCLISTYDRSILQPGCFSNVTYKWDFGDGTTANSANAKHSYTAIGTYIVCLTVQGWANGILCEKTYCQIVEVKNCTPCDMQVSLLNKSDPCFNQSTGVIEVGASGGTPPYFFSISPGKWQSSGYFGYLALGTYPIRARDGNGCEVLLQVTLNQAQQSLSGTVTINQEPYCLGDNSGKITINASGGVAPYLYGIGSGFSTGNTISGLSAGSYVVSVKDASGCIIGIPVTLTANHTISGIILAQSPVSCAGGADGSITVLGQNGTPPYQYAINNGNQHSSGYFYGLTAGNYTLSIEDAKGCQFDMVVTVTTATASAGVNAGPDQTICKGNQVVLSAAPLGIKFNWSPAIGLSCTSCANPVAAPANTTTYTVTHVDIYGCTSKDDVTVFVNDPFAPNLNATITTCPGEVVALNGNAPTQWQYYWSPKSGLSCYTCPSPNASVTTNTTYNITVTDGNCMGTGQITVLMDPLFFTDFNYTLVSGLTVTFTATPSGSNSYSWNFGDLKSGANNIGSGQMATHTFSEPNRTYNICLTAENDCGPVTVCRTLYVEENCVDGTTHIIPPGQ